MNSNTPIFDFKDDIEIKCLRLVQPKINNISLPLSGLYQDINNIEDPNFPLQKKLKNFGIPNKDCVNIENMFLINNKFGKVYVTETLEALLIFANKAEYEIELKDIKIDIYIDKDDKKISKNVCKKCQIPEGKIVLKGRTFFSIHLSLFIDSPAKYNIEFNSKISGKEYYRIYNEASKYRIYSTNNDKYIIKSNGAVEINKYKKLTFETIFPFKAEEKFHNNEMESLYIEETILNKTVNNLLINDIFLYPKKDQSFKINILNSDKIKNIIMEEKEELNVVFKIDDKNIFSNVDKFILEIIWQNLFDINKKIYRKEVENKMNIFNEFFIISVEEKPNENIIQNQSFKINFKLKKKINKVFNVQITYENLKESDKLSEREIEIIDIMEKKIYFKEDTKENFFSLICKSDVLGYTTLPKIKFNIYLDLNKDPAIVECEKLLSFNCIQETNLIN
jgi:hypothetical protein